MDDSIFSRLISLSYPEDKIEMPAFAIRLSPNGIKEIRILGRYGTWLPLSFYNRICSALINQRQYPWIIGGKAGRRTLDYYQNDSLMKSTAKPKTMKEIFIDELTAQMNSEKSYEFECYTFVLRYPSPGLGDNIGIVDNVCPTREELILNRKMFIDNWLSQKISDINDNGIKDSDYELFFDREQGQRNQCYSWPSRLSLRRLKLNSIRSPPTPTAPPRARRLCDSSQVHRQYPIGTITERDTPHPNCRRSKSPPPAAVIVLHASLPTPQVDTAGCVPTIPSPIPQPTIHYPHAPDKAVAIK